MVNWIKKMLIKAILYTTVSVKKSGNDIVFAKYGTRSEGLFLPFSSKYRINSAHLSKLRRGYFKAMIEKYCTSEINIRNDDVVIDCGAFVGGFTVAAAKQGARKIYTIEPSGKNYQCLLLNISHYEFNETVVTINAGLGNVEGKFKLNLSSKGSDDSFLNPDNGNINIYETVDMIRIEKLIEKYHIDPDNTYLKVEAEGLEPEVIEGLGKYMPRVITVDVTPERDGKSPREEVYNILLNKGYKKFNNTPKCLFAYT